VLWKCVETQAPVVLQFPSHGLAVNRAITLRSLIKLLRTRDPSTLPESVRDLAVHMSTAYVSGPGRSRLPPFEIRVYAAEPESEYSIANQLGGYVPRAWQGSAQFSGTADVVPGTVPTPPETPRTDQELFDIIYSQNRIALALLSPAQRARAEELLLIGGLTPTVP
jgi:hypothetical protein